MTNKNRANNVSRLKKIIGSVKKFFSRENGRKQKLREQQTTIEEQKKLIQQLQKSQTEQEEQIRVLNERIEQSEKSQPSTTERPKIIKKQGTEIKEEKSSDFFPQKHGSRVQAILKLPKKVKYGMRGWYTDTIPFNIHGEYELQNAISQKEGYEDQMEYVSLKFYDTQSDQEISIEQVREFLEADAE